MIVYHGDCLDIMPTLAENSIDAIITDPPYGLGFMGKDWDHGVPGAHFWIEALRVAKPGCHLLAFGGTRTFHRLACAIEDAGWELRDTVGYAHESGDAGDCPWLLAWTYGSGFPKSHDVSKAIDKEAGEKREVVGQSKNWRETKRDNGQSMNPMPNPSMVTLPATEAAKRWDGWGTALKPAWEPIIVARKPLEGTVAQNVQKWGTGAMNIDGCRVGTDDSYIYPNGPGGKSMHYASDKRSAEVRPLPTQMNSLGRWPANLIHDGSDEVLELFPSPHGAGRARENRQGGTFRGSNIANWGNIGIGSKGFRLGDSGSAARFFYCAKASKRDRNEGCEAITPKQYSHDGREKPIENAYQRNNSVAHNNHPTVKPTDLMRYLCRLVTPPKGVILDPFMGSGSTGKAAMLEGFDFIGIEKELEYVRIAQERILVA